MASDVPPLSILVVDDEPGLADAIADLLRLDGHQVVTACDGEEALRVAPTGAVHLVLSDLTMPRMSGDALLLAMRARGGPPFWFVLMSSAPQWAVGARLGAADGYLQKAIRPDELESMVAACAAAPSIAARLRAARDCRGAA